MLKFESPLKKKFNTNFALRVVKKKYFDNTNLVLQLNFTLIIKKTTRNLQIVNYNT